MHFNEDQKLAEIILGNHLLLPVLERFNIPLGFGEQSLGQVCRQHGIHVPFFIEVLNAFHDPDYRPHPDPEVFPVPMTIAYLRTAHKAYLEVMAPRIDAMIRELVDSAGDLRERMSSVLDFFAQYTRELALHIRREEEKVFPYALAVDQACKVGNAHAGLIDDIRSYPATAYAGEHDDVEEKLLDLKNILIKYTAPTLDQPKVRRILDALFELEADLNDHSRLEDLILVPVLIPMERQVLAMAEAGGIG